MAWTTIITIGREYGAGGRTVGKLLGQALGIPCYDKELIELAAAQSGVAEGALRGLDDQGDRGILSWLLPSGSVSSYDRAILAQTKAIRTLAKEGPCIIVGRGADYILRDFPDLINVFLYADWADKIRYAAETYGDTPEQAAGRVRRADAARESYYHYLTKARWGELKRYHLSLNTTPVGKRTCAELILQYARSRRRGEGAGRP